MARRNTSPSSFDELLRKHAREGDSFSDTFARILESDDLANDGENRLDYIGAGSSGLPDLGINAEKYLGLEPWGPGEKPGEWPSDKDSG